MLITIMFTVLLIMAFACTVESADEHILDSWYRFPTGCKLTPGGHEYAGTLSKTKSGKDCQAWNSHRPHYNYYTDSKVYPEGSARDAGSYCRNPDYNWHVGAWCYTTDTRTRWESCDVSLCECRLHENGTDYQGQIATTKSNLTCQAWRAQSPHSHNHTADDFLDGNIYTQRNYCRNPGASRPFGPWCYTTDPETQWEYCDVPVCNISFWYRPITTTTTTTTGHTTTTATTTTASSRRTTTTSTTTTARRSSRATTFAVSFTRTTKQAPPEKGSAVTPDIGRGDKGGDTAASRSASTPNIGVVAGVPVAVFLGVAAIAAVVVFLYRERIRVVLQRRPQLFEGGTDNPTYATSTEKVDIPHMNTESMA